MTAYIATTAYLGELLEDLRDLACSCLADSPLGVPADCYVSHGRPPDDCGDYLAVWLERVRPIQPEAFPTTFGGKITCNTSLAGAADIAMKVARSCWPTVRGETQPEFPDPLTEIDPAAVDLLGDATALWCCVTAAALDGSLHPSNGGGETYGITMGSLDVDDPRGGIAGWTLRFALEMPLCCITGS